jgi:hypothetical protein
MRACIFCRSTPVTKEHAFPQWLVRLVGTMPVRVTVRTSTAAREYLGNKIELKVGCACAACNNGWMSSLESQAKPILTPMVLGERAELDDEQQALVALWAIKSVMVFDHLDGPVGPYFRQEEREVFRDDPWTVRKGCMVVAGCYGGNLKASARPGRTTTGRLSGEDTGIPMLRSTLTVGRLLLMVDTDRYREITGREGLVWPPPHFDKTLLLGGPGRATPAMAAVRVLQRRRVR